MAGWVGVPWRGAWAGVGRLDESRMTSLGYGSRRVAMRDGRALVMALVPIAGFVVGCNLLALWLWRLLTGRMAGVDDD